MATRRTFEGTDLEALLGQVRSQLGEDARILSAEKTRSGGVGGFFVKEQYIVVAESRRAERRALTAPPGAARGAGSGVASGAAPRVRVPSAVALGAARVDAPAPAPAPASAAGGAGSSRPAPAPVNTLDRLLAMADAVSAREQSEIRKAPSAPLRRAGESPSVNRTASAAASVRAGDAARRSSFDLMSSRRSGLSVSGAPRPPTPVDSVFARAERMGPVIDLTDSSPKAGPRQRMPRIDGDEIVVAHTATGKRLGRIRPAFADAPRLRRSDLSVDLRDQVETDPEPDPDRAVWVAPTPARRAHQRASGAAVVARGALVGLGVPPEMIALADVTSDELAEMFEELAPKASPEPGLVTVFIGELDAARGVAATHSDEVVIAAPSTPEGVSPWLVVRDPDGARLRRAKWVTKSTPVTIALDGSPLSSNPEWVMTLLDAVGPDQIHLVIDAGWSTTELGDWVHGLTSVVGDEAVVIDLVGTDRAQRPAEVLHLGLPVRSVEGRPADGRVWADMLVSHLLANRMGA